MDDQAVGLAIRRVRLRRNERQQDVAARAAISRTAYSRIERGHLESTTIHAIRAAAAALEIRIGLLARWRGGDLDRLLSARHAVMGERVAGRLGLAGWDVAPEVSFNHFGERGVIDLLAWHARRRALLVVELKTELVDVNEVLGTMDRRRRLMPTIAGGRGWVPAHLGAWLVIADSRTNRRHVAAHRELLRAAFPEDGRQVATWLSEPDRPHSALWFLPDDLGRNAGRGLAPRKRVGHLAPRTTGSESR